MFMLSEEHVVNRSTLKGDFNCHTRQSLQSKHTANGLKEHFYTDIPRDDSLISLQKYVE